MRPTITHFNQITMNMIREYNQYLPTAFNNSLTLIEKVNMVIEQLNRVGNITNEMVTKWNEIMAWIIGEGLELAVEDQLKKWLSDGTLENIIDIALLDNVKGRTLILEKLVQADIHHDFDNFLNFQSVIGKVPTRINDQLDFIQGVAFNQAKNELYVARQLNGGDNVKISRYRLNDYTLIDVKQFAKTGGAYQEGLPYFYNGSGDLCFIVRTAYDLSAAIFNFTKNTLGGQIQLNGGSKMSSDPENKYLVTHFGDASRTEGVYIYDFQSVIDMSPRLLRKVKFDNEIIHGEKAQGIQLVNDKLIISRGSSNPVITAVNLNGTTLNTVYLDKKSLANNIAKKYPNDGINPTDYAYENEGCSWYTVDGKTYPVIHHVTGGGSGHTYFSVVGNPLYDKIETTLPTLEVRDSPNRKSLPLAEGVASYGDDVLPRFWKDRDNKVHLSGTVTHDYWGTTPDRIIAKLPFPYLPSANSFHLSMASGDAAKINKIQVRTNGDVILWQTNTENTTGRQFTTLDGISFYSEGREW